MKSQLLNIWIYLTFLKSNSGGVWGCTRLMSSFMRF
jgi:hypothetical protein